MGALCLRVLTKTTITPTTVIVAFTIAMWHLLLSLLFISYVALKTPSYTKTAGADGALHNHNVQSNGEASCQPTSPTHSNCCVFHRKFSQCCVFYHKFSQCCVLPQVLTLLCFFQPIMSFCSVSVTKLEILEFLMSKLSFI